MANEKRLIDANALDEKCRRQMADQWNQRVAPVSWAEAYEEFLDDVWDAPTVDAVEVNLFNALKCLVNGEWVDCKLVQEALGIDFATGLKLFDFSRTAEWNTAPLNGQKITTKFRMKNAVEVVHGRWEHKKHKLFGNTYDYVCSVCGCDYALAEYNYCPNCGAKMDGDGND